jgi:hypothetical protein
LSCQFFFCLPCFVLIDYLLKIQRVAVGTDLGHTRAQSCLQCKNRFHLKHRTLLPHSRCCRHLHSWHRTCHEGTLWQQIRQVNYVIHLV